MVGVRRAVSCRGLVGSHLSVQRASSLRCASSTSDVVVVGGGAAGLTAAHFAARSGCRVLVLERMGESGKKILMSGGTRCNVLPAEVNISSDFFTESKPGAMKAIFRSWTLEACKEWLEGIGVSMSLEAETKKWFPASNSSRDVREKLLLSCSDAGATFKFHCSVSGVQRLEDGTFCIEVQEGPYKGRGRADGPPRQSTLTAERVIIATGGLSFPAVGTDGTGHRIAASLGHTLHEVYPALTPLTGPHPGGEVLPGVTVPAVDLRAKMGPKAKDERRAERGGFLLTHKGYSVPSVLDLSHHVVKALERGEASPGVRANWTGEGRNEWEERLLSGGAAQVSTVVSRHMPQRLAHALCKEAGVPIDRRASDLRKDERMRLLDALTEQLRVPPHGFDPPHPLTQWVLPVSGHQGYPKAEVTGGGVRLEEVDASTMESRVVPGLHLCGEILDCFGRIGGFNFYWAWVTGRAAGLGAAKGVRGVQ